VLLGEGSALLLAHLPLALQVALVANQHDDDVAVAVLPAVLEPRRKVLEGLTPAIRWSTDTGCELNSPTRLQKGVERWWRAYLVIS
jgi:hypothetical protein